jgi:hypothetical protein
MSVEHLSSCIKLSHSLVLDRDGAIGGVAGAYIDTVTRLRLHTTIERVGVSYIAHLPPGDVLWRGSVTPELRAQLAEEERGLQRAAGGCAPGALAGRSRVEAAAAAPAERAGRGRAQMRVQNNPCPSPRLVCPGTPT